MTKYEQLAKEEIIKQLQKEGYATYARLFDMFDLHLTEDPDTIAYMIPQKAVIVMNKNLTIEQVSTFVRHEILHEYLTHMERKHADDIKNNRVGDQQIANIAADYEISNRGYTDQDKKNVRAVVMGDQVLRGLVTEDDYPDWENKTFEEMYDELEKKSEAQKKAMKQALKDLMSDDEMKKLIDDMQKDMQQEEGQEGEGESGQSGSRQGQQDTNKSKSNNNSSNGEAGDGNDTQNKQDKTGDKNGRGNKDDKASNVMQDTSHSSGHASQNADNNSNRKKQISKALDKAEDQVDKNIKSGKDETPLPTKEEQDAKKELQDRLTKIKKAFDELKDQERRTNDNDLFRPVEQNREKQAQAKRIKDVQTQRIKSTQGIVGFRNSLINFIRDQVGDDRHDTWSKPNKTYSRTPIIRPGISHISENAIPLINVYWDISGSFSSPAKTEGARRAIALLNQYVSKGLIKTKTYYLTMDITDNPNEGSGGGGSGEAVIEHVKQTHPTNVIVITDSDADDCVSSVTVPGAVWLLFYDDRAASLITNLRGKKEDKVFDIIY